MRRRPFFLLEVFIATALIGAFAFLSIRGAYRAIGKERKQLEALETAMKMDIKRMEVIEKCWSQVESMSKEWSVVEGCQVKCKEGKENVYRLTVKQPQGKEYHYVVRRT